MTLIECLRQFLFVREVGGDNHGLWVGFFQQYTGNAAGDSWCCSFLCFCLAIQFAGKSPFQKTGSCQELLDQARKLGWETSVPAPGDIFFYLNDAGHAHHVGVVTGTAPLTGIAGNTSADGKSSNGDGVHEHELTASPAHITFVRPR